MALTKKKIARSIQQDTGGSFSKTYELLEITIEIIKAALAREDDLMISGFGKLSVKEKKARRGRHPQTGADIFLEPRKVVTFHCAGNLKALINDG